MAEIHHTTLVPGKLDLLAEWLPAQRWYAAKGRLPRLLRVGGFRLDDPGGQVGIEILLVADVSGSPPVVYQVPLTYRGAPLAGADGALVGTAEHGVLGSRWIYDGPHDPVFGAGLLDLVQGRAQAQAQSESDTPDQTVVGHPVTDHHVTAVSSSVLRGEQSNTSVICEVVDEAGAPADPVIVKVFRTLQPGDNPDVVVQAALTAAGSRQVPQAVGYVSGTWLEPREPGRAGDSQLAHGHLAFAQRFLPGLEDAWRVALRSAGEGTDFTASARELGEATGHIHLDLARTLGTTPVTAQARAQLLASMRERRATALREVASLAEHDEDLRRVLDAVERHQWPDLQRIHGDYHLGQVLRTADAGWVAVDFEGEPLRPLGERVRPDVALRDVAGMLRSFDYAGGSVERDRPGHSARAWVEDCRAAFLAGYATVAHVDLDAQAPLIRALELDKALYEIVYEARNRPTWISIPATAIDRLIADRKGSS